MKSHWPSTVHGICIGQSVITDPNGLKRSCLTHLAQSAHVIVVEGNLICDNLAEVFQLEITLLIS